MRVLKEDFTAGEIACIRCGKKQHLWFNGGELDGWECCGLTYGQGALRYDLYVSGEGIEDNTRAETAEMIRAFAESVLLASGPGRG